MKKIYFASILTILMSSPSIASMVSVTVTNIKSSDGYIGCALFDSKNGFPMQAKVNYQQWHQASNDGVTFQFKNVIDGYYAVAINHDLNGNRITDTNIFGIPKEDWGVSNNVRPAMRAPTFEEAKFNVAGNTALEVRID